MTESHAFLQDEYMETLLYLLCIVLLGLILRELCLLKGWAPWRKAPAVDRRIAPAARRHVLQPNIIERRLDGTRRILPTPPPQQVLEWDEEEKTDMDVTPLDERLRLDALEREWFDEEVVVQGASGLIALRRPVAALKAKYQHPLNARQAS